MGHPAAYNLTHGRGYLTGEWRIGDDAATLYNFVIPAVASRDERMYKTIGEKSDK